MVKERGVGVPRIAN